MPPPPAHSDDADEHQAVATFSCPVSVLPMLDVLKLDDRLEIQAAPPSSVAVTSGRAPDRRFVR